MKTILLVILIVSFCLTANAKTYVLRDKLTGSPVGVASISEKHISDWAKKFILTEADETYKGKQSYEMKYESGKLRHATTQEISDYLTAQEQEQQNIISAKEKKKFLKWLEDDDVKTKIKNIKNP